MLNGGGKIEDTGQLTKRRLKAIDEEVTIGQVPNCLHTCGPPAGGLPHAPVGLTMYEVKLPDTGKQMTMTGAALGAVAVDLPQPESSLSVSHMRIYQLTNVDVRRRCSLPMT